MEIICFLLAVQSALLFNMIILSKGVKGFLIKQKAIDKQIIFLKCNSTANSQRLSYKCEEDHHSNYGRNFGSCEKKHLIFREWNLSRELCDADNQLFSQGPTGQLGSYNSLYLFHLFPGFRQLFSTYKVMRAEYDISVFRSFQFQEAVTI